MFVFVHLYSIPCCRQSDKILGDAGRVGVSGERLDLASPYAAGCREPALHATLGSIEHGAGFRAASYLSRHVKSQLGFRPMSHIIIWCPYALKATRQERR